MYPWLNSTYKFITQAFKQGFGHHALLIMAEDGLGVESMLSQLANFLLCTSDKQDLKPCGKCHSCHLFNAQNHGDFYKLASIDNKDISVDQVRDVSEKLTQFSAQGGNKVVLIDGVERLTHQASNALLKTLEEPTAKTYFLLKTNLNQPILPTIKSRCQSWLINPPVMTESVTWLQQNLANTEASFLETSFLEQCLRINHQLPLATLNFIRQDLMTKRLDLLRKFWLFYTRHSPLEILPVFEADLVFQQLDWILAFISDAYKLKLGITTNLQCEDIMQGVRKFSANSEALQLTQAYQILYNCQQELSSINGVNQELILLDGLTKLVSEVWDKNSF